MICGVYNAHQSALSIVGTLYNCGLVFEWLSTWRGNTLPFCDSPHLSFDNSADSKYIGLIELHSVSISTLKLSGKAQLSNTEYTQYTINYYETVFQSNL